MFDLFSLLCYYFLQPNLEACKVKKLDPQETVTFKEFLITNAIQIDALKKRKAKHLTDKS